MSGGESEPKSPPLASETSLLSSSRGEHEAREAIPVSRERDCEEEREVSNFQRLVSHGQQQRRQVLTHSAPTLASKVTKTVAMASLHPVRFVHVLIQLGYEPTPPHRRYSLLFRRYMYYWPGLFGYARAIVKRDGFWELYRGVTGCLAAEVVAVLATSALDPLITRAVNALPLKVVPSDGGDTPDNEDNIQTTRAVFVRGVRLFTRQLLVRSFLLVIVQPFYTISVRMIAQHVGKEAIYTSIWTSLREIYREEGLAGFYKGTIPAFLGVVLSSVMHATLWVGLELAANAVSEAYIKAFIRDLLRPFMIMYVPKSYTYPFDLVRTVMAANNSRLAIGGPPHFPIFNGWRECVSHLRSGRSLYRGSAFIFPRYAYTTSPN